MTDTGDATRKQRLNSSKSSSSLSKIQTKSVHSAGKPMYTLEKLVQEILQKRIKRIVVMVGAGISTLSGIPDFRSPGSGLYDNLKQFKIPYPEAIFEIDYFKENPRPFFTLAKELIPSGKYKPNKIHYFIRLLEQKQLLHRLYTQNIDGLELQAGISSDKLVEAHGTFSSAKCITCKSTYTCEFIKNALNLNKIPRCTNDNCNKHLVKPNIVFFGESLPKRFDLHTRDFLEAHLVLVMGTSLAVEPFAEIINKTQCDVPRLLLNREAVGPFKKKKLKKDITLLGSLSESIDVLVSMLGWQNEFDILLKSQNEIDCGVPSKEDNIQQSSLAELFYLDNIIKPKSDTLITQEAKNDIIERNNQILGIKSSKSQTLLSKRQQHNNSQNEKPLSSKAKFNENHDLLPPNYNPFRAKNSSSPFNKEMLNTLTNRLNSIENWRLNARRPSKFLLNSRPLLKATLLDTSKRKSSDPSDLESDTTIESGY